MNLDTIANDKNNTSFTVKQSKSYEIDLEKIQDEVDCINILRILIDGLDIKVGEDYKYFDLVKKYLILD